MKLHLKALEEESRLFFVAESREHAPEIFETYGAALVRLNTMNENEDAGACVKICLVNNYAKDVNHLTGETVWKYRDLENTFIEVGTLCEHN